MLIKYVKLHYNQISDIDPLFQPKSLYDSEEILQMPKLKFHYILFLIFLLRVESQQWIQTTLPSTELWTSPVYGGGKFVILTSDTSGSRAAYSMDGISWTGVGIEPFEISVNYVSYGDGNFVAVGQSEYGYYSYDGINWKQFDMPSNQQWGPVTYGGGKFVAISAGQQDGSNDIAAYSSNGINWVQFHMPSAQSWFSIIYGGGKFLAVSLSEEGSNSILAYSYDAITWYQVNLPSGQFLNSIAYGNGKFIAIHITGEISYSGDGINWILSNGYMPEMNGVWSPMAYGNGIFMAICGQMASSNVSAYSIDGITWNEIPLPSSQAWQSISYGDGKFVAIVSGMNTASIAAYLLVPATSTAPTTTLAPTTTQIPTTPVPTTTLVPTTTQIYTTQIPTTLAPATTQSKTTLYPTTTQNHTT